MATKRKSAGKACGTARRRRPELTDEQLERFRDLGRRFLESDGHIRTLDAVTAETLEFAAESDAARKLVEQSLGLLLRQAERGDDGLAEWVEHAFGLPLWMVRRIANPLDMLQAVVDGDTARRQRERGIAEGELARGPGLHGLRDRLVAIRDHVRAGNPLHTTTEQPEVDGFEVEPCEVATSRALELWHERGEGLAALEADLLGQATLQALLLEATYGVIEEDEGMPWVPEPYDPVHRARLVRRAQERVDELLAALDVVDATPEGRSATVARKSDPQFAILETLAAGPMTWLQIVGVTGYSERRLKEVGQLMKGSKPPLIETIGRGPRSRQQITEAGNQRLRDLRAPS